MKQNDTKDRLQDIFDEQWSLTQKFAQIECANGLGAGLVEGLDFNLDDPIWQYVIKDHIFRVVEELVEAEDAYTQTDQLIELTDALHFMVELILIVPTFRDLIVFFQFSPDYSGDLLDRVWEYSEDPSRHPAEENWASPIYYLGMASNCLKNRPWKRTIQETDFEKFVYYLRQAFRALIQRFKKAGVVDPQGVYYFYFQKNIVNQTRIEHGV